MACIGCSCSTGKDSSGSKSSPSGCNSNGGCATGGCNRHNTYDWITAMGITDAKPFDIVEVSFKNGSRKEFFKNPPYTRTTTGDWVIVESFTGGYDVGKVSLSGELVRLQMKRKRVRPDARLQTVVRKAHDRDLERLDEVRREEKQIMVQARAIARTLDLDMKVGDVEFQGDGRKCTFYYTADGRVDFRELIRQYAREFKVKIEMRQIGARQESARIGGLGNCGRELCCSTWLTEFKSVNTAAARYQNLAINQTKLSGMCGRLKCCLNYELDTYIDALEDFPDRAERIKTAAGTAILVKTDVFKRLMYYTYVENRGKFYAIHVDQVWEALAMIKQSQTPGSLEDIIAMAPAPEFEEPEEAEPDFENVHDVIQLPMEKRKKKKKKKSGNRDRSQSAAAAVEKAAQDDNKRPAARPQGRDQRRDNRGAGAGGPQRPPARDGAGKPDQRAPQQPRPPRDGDKPRPENRPDNRPPRDGDKPRTENRPDQRPPRDNDNPRPENRPDNRPPRDNDKPRPENRPDNRPPRDGDKPEQRKPDARPPRPEQKGPRPDRPDNRPPRPERPPMPPGDKANPPADKPAPPEGGGDANRNKNRGKDRRFKGKPPGPKKTE